MAQQTIAIGTTANDGQGDPLRVGIDKANKNFTEIYGKIPPFDQQYASAAPTTRSDGTTLQDGDRWFDTLKRCNRSWSTTYSRWLIEPGQFLDPKWFAVVYDDFLSAPTTNSTPLTSGTSGGSVGTSSNNIQTNCCGTIQLTTSTTTTGRGSVFSNSSAILMGQGTCYFSALVQIVNASTSTDAFTVWVGLSDANASDPVDGACLKYTHANNSGSWQALTANNSTISVLNTSSTTVADGSVYKLEVFVNADATQADFFINGASAGSPLTTNIAKTTGRETGLMLTILKSAGTNSRVLRCDDLLFIQEFTTAR